MPDELTFEQKNELNKAYDVFERYVNNVNHEARRAVAKHIAQKFCQTHNTLQQSLGSLMLEVIREIAASKPYSDLRNQAVIEFINGMAQQDIYFPFV